MRYLTESTIESKVRKWATNHGWVTYKLSGLGAKGKADRIFLGPGGITIFMEFKRQDGGKHGELQEWHKRKLSELGHTTYFINSTEEGIAILREAGEPYGTTD